eukprot:3500464-Pyramimonas_sp.AAC.2
MSQCGAFGVVDESTTDAPSAMGCHISDSSKQQLPLVSSSDQDGHQQPETTAAVAAAVHKRRISRGLFPFVTTFVGRVLRATMSGIAK